MTQIPVGPRPVFGSPPAAGEWLEVAAGVFWSRIALPFRLNHVNVYLIDDGASWNIVDTGISNKASQETWDRLLGGRMAGRTVCKVIVTHHHPDHVGLSSWLANRLGAEVVMSGTEYLLGLTYWLDSDAMITPSLTSGTEHYARVMADRFAGKMFAKAAHMAALGIVTKEDLAGLVVFLASPAAAKITGQAISMTGGISAL